MTANRINRLISLLTDAIKTESGVRKIYCREALRCINNARVYLAQGDASSARYACERAVFWYELAR